MSAAPRLIRAAALPARPWKNGGGDTREIAAGPPGAKLDAFDWRLSLARVASDGPFSLFPGVDRTLTVLDGGTMRLAVDGQPGVVLGPDEAPFAFAGDVPAHATLSGEPLVDCNVMTRRGAFTHQVRAVAVQGETAARMAGAELFVVGRRGTTTVAGKALASGDALWWSGVGPQALTLQGTGAEVLIVEIVQSAPDRA